MTYHEGQTVTPIDTAEITNRTYEQYMDVFALDEEHLKGQTILDLAGGLSNFTNIVTEKFGASGTTCRSIDASYKLLADLKEDAGYDSFNDAVRANNNLAQGKHISFGASNQRRGFDEKDWDAGHAAIDERIKEMRTERIKAFSPINEVNTSNNTKGETADRLPQIAGSAYELPFKSESFDLVVSSNFLLYPMRLDEKAGSVAMDEAIRLLKDNGELRIWPIANLSLKAKPGEITLVDTRNMEVDAEFNPIYKRYEPAFDKYTQLENEGYSIYYVETDQTDVLIIKKGNKPPEGTSGTNLHTKLLKFSETEEGSIIVPFTAIN